MKFLGVPWGLRPRWTEQKLALLLLSLLPSAHLSRVGVRVVCFRGSMATPPILYLRFTASLAVAAQDSRPSGSLLLSCKALSSSTSCRFIPAHINRRSAHHGSMRGRPDFALHESIFFGPARTEIPNHATTIGDGLGGLGLIGIDVFAPNNLSLPFFTVRPFNE
jgi:hypothetical protein